MPAAAYGGTDLDLKVNKSAKSYPGLTGIAFFVFILTRKIDERQTYNRVKIILFGLLSFVLSSFKSENTSCKYVEAFSPIELVVLRNYVGISQQKNFIRNGKGIVHLTISKGENGLPQWYLSTHMDDIYLDSPPAKWTMIHDEMVLIWDESTGANTLDSAALNERVLCLEDLLGNRVYQRSNRKRKGFAYSDKGVRILDQEGQPKMREVGNPLFTGNYFNDVVIVFEKNGTYKTKIPV
jgi:hypothetical protein